MASRAEYPHLVRRDGAHGGAEHGGMVEIDVGQDGDVGLDDVGGVPRTAKSYFDDAYVHAFIRKVQKRRDRE